ncbi:MAG TPA: helix-turn-helix domain-containing protein [Propionicimonas sp.]|jgi:excisionase family DNA binding protein
MNHPIPDRAHLLTIDEACQALGIGRTKTYELVMSGVLASVKIGSRRLVAVTTIAQYIEQCLKTAADAHPLSREVIEDLVKAGELRSVTLDNSTFVSVDSLDAYARSSGQAAS